MKILTIDTSTNLGSIGILEDTELIAQMDLNLPTTHNQRLIKGIETLLEWTKIKLNSVELLTVVHGPGSFTGLRIGVATAKGLAYALDKPLIGINGLDALASNFPFSRYLICPILDARKKQVFTALYEARGSDVIRISEYNSIIPEKLLKGLRRKTIFTGTGVKIYKDLISQKMKERCLLAPEHLQRIYPQGVARLALKIFKKGGDFHPAQLTPFYIRPSDAELNY